MTKGTINVQTENIFPIIKKFLYSDHEIFLRELVSNGVDATQKLKFFSSSGEFNGELGDLTVEVILDKEAKTLIPNVLELNSGDKKIIDDEEEYYYINDEYKNQLKSFTKKLFDPFKRKSKFDFMYNDITFTTTGEQYVYINIRDKKSKQREWIPFL